ncbi:hypothetical protein BDZ89DRAFT_1126087 [Hymenopellis radicata]|nr:hypothetical protein BDZ89DRAFT_1126087 [Hymenopellis radicata]
MSYTFGNQGTRDSRPTLPPIRDLFAAELSGSPRTVHESPSAALARLSVRDQEPDARIESGYSGGRRYGSMDLGSFYRPSHDTTRSVTSAPQTPSLGYRASLSSSRPSTPLFSASSLHHETRHSQDVFYTEALTQPTFFKAERRSTHPDISYGLPREKRRSLDMGTLISANARPPSSSTRNFPKAISTEFEARHKGEEDDDPTPVARFRSGPSFERRYVQNVQQTKDDVPSAAAFKYECKYCGKGFNRPSSLKIHINSHTGEKPFACTVEGCGRSFSVLSNMRRHARVHTQAPAQAESSSDEGSEIPSTPPHSASSQSSIEPSRRRDSIISNASSTGSRRSRSLSCGSDDDLHNDAPPEKRRRSHRQP